MKDTKVPAGEDIHRALSEVLKKAKGATRDLDDEKLGKNDTCVPCAIPMCKGTVIEEKSRKYFGDPMRRIIGPGVRHQLTLVVERYCSRCGISYHHLPEPPRT